MFNLFKSLAKAFKPVVNTVNTVVQNIAKQYGSGWFSKGVQTVTDSVNKVAENPNNTGSSGYSSNVGSAPIVQGINDEDNDSVVKRAKRKKKSNSSPAPTQPDPIPEDVGVTTENPIVIYRSRDQKLTEAEEDQINYLLAVEDDPLAKDMLLKIKNEGLPQDIEFADYMKQFAQWGWDDLSDEHARALMEIVMQDRANDQIESLVVFDEDTGFVILDRIGMKTPDGEDFVGIQIEEIEMMRGRDIIMVHNHPGSLKASDEDLQVAWLAGAEKVIILTPEGFEYVYKPGKSGMEFIGKNDLPFEVAPPTLDEYLQLRKLSRQQAIVNYYNRPEYVMFQDELEAENNEPNKKYEGLEPIQGLREFGVTVVSDSLGERDIPPDALTAYYQAVLKEAEWYANLYCEGVNECAKKVDWATIFRAVTGGNRTIKRIDAEAFFLNGLNTFEKQKDPIEGQPGRYGVLRGYTAGNTIYDIFMPGYYYDESGNKIEGTGARSLDEYMSVENVIHEGAGHAFMFKSGFGLRDRSPIKKAYDTDLDGIFDDPSLYFDTQEKIDLRLYKNNNKFEEVAADLALLQVMGLAEDNTLEPYERALRQALLSELNPETYLGGGIVRNVNPKYIKDNSSVATYLFSSNTKISKDAIDIPNCTEIDADGNCIDDSYINTVNLAGGKYAGDSRIQTDTVVVYGKSEYRFSTQQVIEGDQVFPEDDWLYVGWSDESGNNFYGWVRASAVNIDVTILDPIPFSSVDPLRDYEFGDSFNPNIDNK